MLKQLLLATVLGATSFVNAENADLAAVAAQFGYIAGMAGTGQLRRQGLVNPKKGTVPNAFFEKSAPAILAALAKALFRTKVGNRLDTNRSTLKALCCFALKLAAKAPKAFCGYNGARKCGQDFPSFAKSWACANPNLTDPKVIAAAYVLLNVLQDGRLAGCLDEDLANATKAMAGLVDDGDLVVPFAHDKHVAVHAKVVTLFVTKFIVPLIFNKFVRNTYCMLDVLANIPHEVINEQQRNALESQGIEDWKKGNILYGLFEDLTSAFLIAPLVTASLRSSRLVEFTKWFTGQVETVNLVLPVRSLKKKPFCQSVQAVPLAA